MNEVPCDNCCEFLPDEKIVHTYSPSGKPIQVCPACDEEDCG